MIREFCNKYLEIYSNYTDTEKLFIWIGIFAIISSVLFPIIHTVFISNKIKKLADNSLEVTPKQFFVIRNASNGGRGNRHISTSRDFQGVYILYNHTKNMYYVGQSVKVLRRVNAHFTGHGNGDVYADFKYGDDFTIKMIKLETSGFKTLNELERNTIKTYGAFSKGYNKTRGNIG